MRTTNNFLTYVEYKQFNRAMKHWFVIIASKFLTYTLAADHATHVVLEKLFWNVNRGIVNLNHFNYSMKVWIMLAQYRACAFTRLPRFLLIPCYFLTYTLIIHNGLVVTKKNLSYKHVAQTNIFPSFVNGGPSFRHTFFFSNTKDVTTTGCYSRSYSKSTGNILINDDVKMTFIVITVAIVAGCSAKEFKTSQNVHNFTLLE